MKIRTLALMSLGLLLSAASAAQGQSLHLDPGQRAVEASVGWSVGPLSTGIETSLSATMNGRLDVGVGISRYTYTFDEGTKSSYNEYAPFFRYFLTKEQAGAPLSLDVSAQYFQDDFSTTETGRYFQTGVTAYKAFSLSERMSIQPFVGFGYVAESYGFGGAPPERAQYLTRDLGLHFTTRTDRPWVLRLTLLEQSYRSETYRGARIAIIRIL
jgi:hypothetical protein